MSTAGEGLTEPLLDFIDSRILLPKRGAFYFGKRRESNDLNAVRMSAAREAPAERLLDFIDSRILLTTHRVVFLLGTEGTEPI